ncbi:MAG: hypothetical protein IJ831_01945 [Spirochaetales bacterium]|nr:hypothetical protein [Spirochaetales bacterium]
MDILRDNPGKLFRRYFLSSFAGSFIVAIYSIIDSIMIGQYEGPVGAAAVACILPAWNIILSFGSLAGIGGSVYFSHLLGEGRKRDAQEYFTLSVIVAGAISLLCFVVFLFKSDDILRLFGADETLLSYARRYLFSVQLAIPFFIFGNILIPYTRADGKPLVTTIVTLAGGAFNIVGDYIFVFVMDMGIFGAGLATAIGEVIIETLCILYLLTHTSDLGFAISSDAPSKLKRLLFSGLPSFVMDIATGILALSFNRQIMRYYGSDVLAIYSCIGNIVFVLSFSAFAIGQSAQPLISKNLGAGYERRASELTREALKYVLALSLAALLVVELFPRQLIRLFMSGSVEFFASGESYIRRYFICLVFYFFNIFITYYFQTILKNRIALAVSILRSFALSLVLVIVLPALFGREAIWYAVPITEIVVFAISIFMIAQERRRK